MTDPPTSTLQDSTAAEQKTRGANRSTKVSGKLKVLPEQPEPDIVPTRSGQHVRPLYGSEDLNSGDSEDGDDEDEDEEAEEVQVR